MFMTQDVLNFVKEKTEALMAAPSCSREAKEAAKAWLDAVGTDKEAEETKKYIQELEGDIMPIDMLIDFAQSPAGAAVFGDRAQAVADHAKEIKAGGAKYCDCPACAAAEAILAKKDDMFKVSG